MSAPTAPLLDLPGVTLLCVDNRTPALALAAMQRCRAQIRFARSLLFTDAATAAGPLPEGIEALEQPIASVPEYSRFMLQGLLPHVHTPHLLIVQWDGYLLDAAQWDPAFLTYDYLGAPLRDVPPGAPADWAVGNGGFSLRSRKLLQALMDPRVTPTHPEDLCICQQHRTLLEQEHGIRFAPLALAQRFAYERIAPDGPTLGFHGLFNLHRVLGPAELGALIDSLPDSMCRGMDARDLCRALLRTRWPNGQHEAQLDNAGRLLAKRLSAGVRDRRTRQLQLKLALLRLRARLGR